MGHLACVNKCGGRETLTLQRGVRLSGTVDDQFGRGAKSSWNLRGIRS